MTSPNLSSNALGQALTLAQPSLAEPAPEDPTATHQHWLSVASMLADAAFETDSTGAFTAFGPGDEPGLSAPGFAMLGFSSSDLLGQNLSALMVLNPGVEEAANSFNSIFAIILEQNVIWRGTGVVERGDGSQGTYHIVLAPKTASDGSREGTYGLLIDLHAPELRLLARDHDGSKAALDPQTGLWASASFIDAAARRFDRLDVEELPGTLLLLGFSRTPLIGRSAVAISLANELRDIIRPTDLLGRLTTTTFALWCDGMDNLTGAERAARFCQRLPAALPGNTRISIGLVARWPGSADDPQTLISRATAALHQADKISQAAAASGTEDSLSLGTWRVWNHDVAF